MRILLFILLLASAVFPCTTVTSAELINTTDTLGQFDCITIIDLNWTVNVTELRQGNTIIQIPYQQTTDSVTNNIYVCNYSDLNINQTLPHGSSYDNNNYNIHLRCEESLKLNEIRNVQAGESYTYAGLNLTFNATHPDYAINRTLDYGEHFNLSEAGIFLTAPEVANLSGNYVLTYGETINITGTSITVSAPYMPTYNMTSYMLCDEFVLIPEIGLSVYAPECLDDEIQLNHGEIYEVPEWGLQILAPLAAHETRDLAIGERYINEELDLDIGCMSSGGDLIEQCRNISESTIVNNWTRYNLDNYTCLRTAVVCIDNLTSYCKAGDKYDDVWGFMRCFDANLDSMNKEKISAAQEIKIIREEKELIEKACNTPMEFVEYMAEEFGTIIAIGAVVICLALLGIWFLVKKNAELKGGKIE